MIMDRVQRRMAAILAADVVGYSRLMGVDEAATLAALNAHRKELVDAKIAEHQGRIVKLTGDGMLVEFPSVVNAVACAAAVQRGMADRNVGISSDRRVEFRIGVNLGDVIVEGDDIFGDGVNVAARLEGIAPPGGIAVSGTVLDHIGNRLDIVFEDIGDHTLKNIERPVRVWRWTSETAPDPASVSLPLPDKPSIAVLPFDNLSGQPEETYFSDGITEDIITGLARFRSLFVIARNSSFAFRGKPIDIAEIGRKLGVTYILEGSVRRAGDRVRITAQLIEAATSAHLWAERYDRNLDDIFAVQDEVARMIVSMLVGRIEDARLKESLRKPTVSLAAYDLVLRGLAHFRGYADDDNQKAYEMFKQAAKLDPQYALAHAYLAMTWVAVHGNASAPADVLDAAFATAAHAAELDPHESRCQRALAVVWLFRREYDTAEHHFRRALELNPNDPDRMMGVGYILTVRGRAEEGLARMEEAMRLNPLYPTWYNIQLSIALYSLGRYAEAAQALKRRPNPSYWSNARLAACLAQLGQTAEAEAQAATVLRLRRDFRIPEFLRRDIMLEREEDREHLRQGLIRAGLPE